MSEAEIQKLVIAWLKTNNVYCWRNNTTGVYDPKAKAFRQLSGVGALVGVSDILGILSGGRFLAIEVKCKTGKVSADQSKFIEQINASGGLAGVVRSLDEAKAMLCNIVSNSSKSVNSILV